MQTFFGVNKSSRLAFLFACLGLEVVLVILTIDFPAYENTTLSLTNRYVLTQFESIKLYWSLCFWVLAGCVAVLSPNFSDIWHFYLIRIQHYPWLLALAGQLIAFSAFLSLSVLQFDSRYLFIYMTHGWFVVWLVLGCLVSVFWLFALAPLRFWTDLIVYYRSRLLAGVLVGGIVGITVVLLVHREAPLGQETLWTLLSGLTLHIVHSLLTLVYSDLVYEPETLEVGTSEFPIKIYDACSGIEGIVLITGFLTVYVYLFRKKLQFPQVWWLFPIGIIAIWLANSLRIALLVVIGQEISPEIAVDAFHAHAGWIAFTIIALLLITLVHRLRFFSIPIGYEQEETYSHQLAIALLAPWLVQIGSAMVTSAFTGEFDLLYPLRIAITAAVLYRYRRIYRSLDLAASWEAVLTGLLVFLIWMILEPPSSPEALTSGQELDKLPLVYAVLWVFFRNLGSIVIVPLAEEFAFRGYLIRKLISSGFENISPKTFTWLSFLFSSFIFGILHERWLAGFIAGMCYALIQYRHGRIGDAIAAHMTTNALIALSVLMFGQWSLWQ